MGDWSRLYKLSLGNYNTYLVCCEISDDSTHINALMEVNCSNLHVLDLSINIFLSARLE